MSQLVIAIGEWAGIIGLIVLVSWIRRLMEYRHQVERRSWTLGALRKVRDGVFEDYPVPGRYEIQQDTAEALEVFGAHPAIVRAAASGEWEAVNNVLGSHLDSESDNSS